MLLATKATLALRCPECGKLDLHRLCLFDFGHRRTLRLTCRCGAEKGSLGRHGNRFWLRFPCLLCDEVHFMYWRRADFWHSRLKTLTCPGTELEVGFYGLDEQLRGGIAQSGPADERHRGAASESAVASEPIAAANPEPAQQAPGDFFSDPAVMYRQLRRLHDLARRGRLACRCGQKAVRLDIFPDRLELRCPACGRFSRIPASRERDALALEGGPAGTDAGRRRRGGERPE